MHKVGILEFMSIGATAAMPETKMAVRAALIEFISPALVASEKAVHGGNGVTALPQKRTTCGIQMMGGALLMAAEPYDEILARWMGALQEDYHARRGKEMAE